MKTKSIFTFLLAILIAALTVMPLAASPSQQNPPPPPGTPVRGASVTITDIMGRTVTLPRPATRVVGTHNPTLNIAIVLGGGGRYLAGFGNKNMAGSLYRHVYPELMDQVPQIGTGRNINFESCIAVGADLAILPERFADLAPQFENLGIPAAVILPNSESYETIKKSIELLGALLGENERAARINACYDRKIENAKAIAVQIRERPRVMFTGGSSQLTVANGLMLQSVMIETVGAINVARDVGGRGEFAEVSLEQIIAWNPDVIYIPAYASYTVNDLINNPAWASINAIRNRRVYSFPSLIEPWDYPTPSTLMGLGWMLNNLYPHLYSMEQVLADAREYYELIYGQSFTAEQLGLN